jgi:hypothetical protein
LNVIMAPVLRTMRVRSWLLPVDACAAGGRIGMHALPVHAPCRTGPFDLLFEERNRGMTITRARGQRALGDPEVRALR